MASYTDKFKGRVKAEYEVGVDSKGEICKRYKIPRKTLLEWAAKGKWIWQKSHQEVIEKVTKSTTEKLANEISYNLEDFTKEHIKNLNSIEKLTKASISRLAKAANETKNNVSKAESEAVFAQQKFLKIATETLEIGYKNKRLALGMDKEKATVMENTGIALLPEDQLEQEWKSKNTFDETTVN